MLNFSDFRFLFDSRMLIQGVCIIRVLILQTKIPPIWLNLSYYVFSSINLLPDSVRNYFLPSINLGGAWFMDNEPG